MKRLNHLLYLGNTVSEEPVYFDARTFDERNTPQFLQYLLDHGRLKPETIERVRALLKFRLQFPPFGDAV